MKKNRFRLFLLAALLSGIALLSATKEAVACYPYLCWNVDENTVCCWEEDCTLWCG